MQFPSDRKYTTHDEWVLVDGDTITVGLTDYAQDALGDVVFVDLPDVGVEVTDGGAMSEVESTKSVSDVYAPVAGTVVEVNGDLADAPERLNDDPYGDGWIVRMRLDDMGALDGLMDAAAYAAMLGE